MIFLSLMKLHIVKLTKAEKYDLERLSLTGSHPARVIRRARILLKAYSGLTDTVIAQHLDCTPQHVARIRQRYCVCGLKRALSDAPRSGRPPVLREKDKAAVAALACTTAPPGCSHWTLDLLTEAANKAEIRIGRTKVWKIMQEHKLKPWREKNVVRAAADR